MTLCCTVMHSFTHDDMKTALSIPLSSLAPYVSPPPSPGTILPSLCIPLLVPVVAIGYFLTPAPLCGSDWLGTPMLEARPAHLPSLSSYICRIAV